MHGTCGESDTRRSEDACILEAHESTRKRLERTLPKENEGCIAGKGFGSQFIPMPQAMKIPDVKADGQKMGKARKKLSAWQMTRVKSIKKVIKEDQREQRTVHFASLMGLMSPPELGVGITNSQMQRLVCIRVDIV